MTLDDLMQEDWHTKRASNDESKRSFLEVYGTYSNLKELGKGLKEDPFNPDYVIKAGESIKNDPSFFASKINGNLTARGAVTEASENVEPKLADYVRNNIDYFTQNLEGDYLKGVIISSKLSSSNSLGEEQKRLVSLIGQLRKLASGDPNEINTYLEKKASESFVDGYLLQNYSGGDTQYDKYLLESYQRDMSEEVSGLMKKLGDDKLREIVRVSAKKSKDNGIYLGIAGANYKREVAKKSIDFVI